jgi:hypothetical protein
MDQFHLMAGGCQGIQADPGERRDEILLMTKAVAKTIKTYQNLAGC